MESREVVRNFRLTPCVGDLKNKGIEFFSDLAYFQDAVFLS
jgi:hypothetical protein